MKRLALLIPALVACNTVDSDNILTSGMYADIEARATGNGITTVSATLFLEDPLELNFIELTGDDQLIASFGTQEKVMNETIILNIVGHHADFQTDLEDDEFVVSFERSVDNGAPESIVTLPAPFNIVPPPASNSRAAVLDIDWQPADTLDLMSWTATGTCIDLATDELDRDVGTVQIPGNTFKKKQGTNIPDSCDVTLTLSRERLGTLDRGFGEGGEVTGEQVRTITFMSTP